MKRMQMIGGLAACAILLATASVASGDITQIFDPADLQNGPFTLEEFEDEILEFGVTYSDPGGTYPDANGPFRVTHDDGSSGVGPSGIWGLASSPGPLTLAFDLPASSVGMWIGNDEFSFDAVLSIFNGADLLGTISVTTSGNDFIDQFLGFNSDEEVTHVSLDYGNNLAEYVDDVYFNVIPGPGGLMLLALAGIGGTRRRRR